MAPCSCSEKGRAETRGVARRIGARQPENSVCQDGSRSRLHGCRNPERARGALPCSSAAVLLGPLYGLGWGRGQRWEKQGTLAAGAGRAVAGREAVGERRRRCSSLRWRRAPGGRWGGGGTRRRRGRFNRAGLAEPRTVEKQFMITT